jgi:hypothetical protein
MAIRRSFSPTFTTKTRQFDGNTLKNSTDYKFRIQSAPPLSLQQYVRSSTILPGAPPWQSHGIYRRSSLHKYLSPEKRKEPEIPEVKPWIHAYRRKYSIPTYSLKHYNDLKPKPTEPIWHPPGRYQEKRPTSLSPEKKRQEPIREPVWHSSVKIQYKRPTSLSPEKKRQEPIREPVWHSSGKTQHKPVPYFDPPNLRWSLQELLKSMPETRPKALRASRSVSVMRRSQYMKDT